MQEGALHQRIQRVVTRLRVEAPQPLRLPRRQLKTGHLEESALIRVSGLPVGVCEWTGFENFMVYSLRTRASLRPVTPS